MITSPLRGCSVVRAAVQRRSLSTFGYIEEVLLRPRDIVIMQRAIDASRQCPGSWLVVEGIGGKRRVSFFLLGSNRGSLVMSQFEV
jgi:hypothetical protein